MPRWTLSPEQRRMQMALLLLVVSGVIRPATLEPTYFGAERIAAVPPGEVADN